MRQLLRGGQCLPGGDNAVGQSEPHGFLGVDRPSGEHDAAVTGLALPYSNGPTEGVVNTITMPKRQIYGKTSFPLLPKRTLLVD